MTLMIVITVMVDSQCLYSIQYSYFIMLVSLDKLLSTLRTVMIMVFDNKCLILYKTKQEFKSFWLINKDTPLNLCKLKGE